MILQVLEDKESPLVGDPADEFVDERLDARIDRRVRIIGNFFERGHGGKSNSLFWVTMALSGAFFPLESIDISWLPHHPTNAPPKEKRNENPPQNNPRTQPQHEPPPPAHTYPPQPGRHRPPHRPRHRT